jgi:magnesium chelatase subunit H
VFSDGEIRTVTGEPNPTFISAVQQADIFIGSLIFDYDDVQVVRNAISVVPTRLIFESATELMEFNQVGTFNMLPSSSSSGTPTPPGPPPAVKAVLSKFSSGKEEDKLNGWLPSASLEKLYYNYHQWSSHQMLDCCIHSNLAITGRRQENISIGDCNN